MYILCMYVYFIYVCVYTYHEILNKEILNKQTRNVIDNVCVNNAFLIEIMFILKAIKSHF